MAINLEVFRQVFLKVFLEGFLEVCTYSEGILEVKVCHE